MFLAVAKYFDLRIPLNLPTWLVLLTAFERSFIEENLRLFVIALYPASVLVGT